MTLWDTFSIQRDSTSDKTPVAETHGTYIYRKPKKNPDWSEPGELQGLSVKLLQSQQRTLVEEASGSAAPCVVWAPSAEGEDGPTQVNGAKGTQLWVPQH